MTLQEIKKQIEHSLPGSTAYVLDPMQDGQHLQAFVVSDAFEGLPVFKQQQLVMMSIKDIFSVVHALSLKTFTPAKWDEARHQYGL